MADMTEDKKVAGLVEWVEIGDVVEVVQLAVSSEEVDKIVQESPLVQSLVNRDFLETSQAERFGALLHRFDMTEALLKRCDYFLQRFGALLHRFYC
jgi:hypothetical protein